MRSLYRIEYLYLIKELKALEGQFFRKCKLTDKGFIIKFNKSSLTLNPPYRLNITFFDYEGEANAFCKKLKKELFNKKLLSIDLYNQDRIIIMDFNEKKLILEMFSKGNIVLTEGDKIIYALKEMHYSKRNIKIGETYKFPPSLPLTSDQWFIDYKEKPLGAMLTMMFGKPYAKYFINTYKLQEKALVKSIPNIKSLIASFLNELRPFSCDNDFAVKPLGNCKQSESLSKLIDEYYKNLRVEDKKNKELQRTIEHLKEQLTKQSRIAELMQQNGNFIYEHYDAIQFLLNKAKENPDILKDIAIIDKKNKTIRIKKALILEIEKKLNNKKE